ncbi:hypothetical protein H3Z85_17925 [Chryseobacterium indologenes]|uniref:hypothetical protein n=1 Tax=Chryseobacterium indologenes TaxID=253 RepID=UPI0003E080AE|nr:hypothetical protein [Chryseobacterium indologenes]QPQ51188.1 hypothetical protein H3Z85_17925 [Chryseobacterium indologenes]GAE66774.1 hypothetical protein CIN01S_18_01010 [Chryseobacterium indologenes NBRC 14944]SFK01263.1 hypothetical protein SAMN05421692_3125 [Chryseobacterium indologenes]SUX49575.1 Uncharacterised protein [Chryseobacterium indologenes]
MKNILLKILLCISANCAAQNSDFSNIENFVPGHRSIYLNAESSTEINPGSSGENITWDFRNLVFKVKDTAAQQIIKIDETSHKLDYPKATIAEKNSDGSWVFIERTENESLVWGVITAQGLEMKYVTPYKFLKKPIKFGESFTGIAKREYEVRNTKITGTNNYSTLVDGTGHLVLKDKKYENVIRLKFIQEFNDGVGDNATKVRIESYVWFDNLHKAAVLKIDNLSVTNKWYNNKSYNISFLLDEKNLN